MWKERFEHETERGEDNRRAFREKVEVRYRPVYTADRQRVDEKIENIGTSYAHAIFVFCWTQRRRKDDRRMVCAHQRRSSSVDFTKATVVGPIRKTNRSNNRCMVCAGQRHPSHQPTDHRPITVKHLRDA